MDQLAALTHIVPVLLVVVPLLGMAMVAIARLAGDRAAEQTLQSNLLLGVSLGVLLLICYDVAPDQDSLTAADSFQFVSRIRLPSGTPLTFGVDGVVLFALLALFTFAPALLCGASSPESGGRVPATSFLAWIASTALVMVAADLLTLAVAVLLSTACSWWFVSASRLRNLPGRARWLRLNLLSAFLIVGGLLGLRTSVVHFLFEDRAAEVTFSFPEILRALEVTSEVDAEQTLQFDIGVAWWLALAFWGCLIRFPMIPLAGGPAQYLRNNSEPARLFLWMNGPVIGLAILWRCLQISPETGFSILAGLTVWCGLAVFWFGLAACGANDPSAQRGAILMQSAALLGVGATSAGEIAAAGTLMLTLAVAVDCGIRSLAGSPQLLRRTAAGVRIAAGGVILWGVIPSEGFGLTLLLAGVGLALGIAASMRTISSAVRQSDRLVKSSGGPKTGSQSTAELPVFSRSAAVEAEAAGEPNGFRRFAAALLLIPLAALCWPELIWSRVRSDVRHLEIARPVQESSNGEAGPRDNHFAAASKEAQ